MSKIYKHISRYEVDGEKMTKCWLCAEQEATEKIRDPNIEQTIENPFDTPLVEVCWDCKMFIKWGKLHMMAMITGLPIKPFPEWLFDTEGVWPKNPEYFSAVIYKKEKQQKEDK